MKSPVQEQNDQAAMTKLDTLLSDKKYLAVTIPVDEVCQGNEEALDEMQNYQYFNCGVCSPGLEFDRFKNIEKNIRREILDSFVSSTEETPSLKLNES